MRVLNGNQFSKVASGHRTIDPIILCPDKRVDVAIHIMELLPFSSHCNRTLPQIFGATIPGLFDFY